jgi:hypothetical protein
MFRSAKPGTAPDELLHLLHTATVCRYRLLAARDFPPMQRTLNAVLAVGAVVSALLWWDAE